MTRRVSDLGAPALRRQLKGKGLRLHIGPYVLHLRSSVPEVAAGVAALYTHYPLADEDGFVDFRVNLTSPKGLRRWLRPQVLFLFDDHTPFKPLPRDQAFPFLEWGLNWCVHRHLHQHLVLHAAVVERGGRAAILPGAPGAGKSTLCAALVSRGWRLFSDELALFSLADGSLTPFPRPISLKNESIPIIKAFAPDAVFGPLATDTDKGTVAHMRAPLDSVERWSQPARPAWFIFPQFQAGGETAFDPQAKGRSFMRLAQLSFNYGLLGLAGFRALSRLVETCACFDFLYGHLPDAITAFDDLASS